MRGFAEVMARKTKCRPNRVKKTPFRRECASKKPICQIKGKTRKKKAQKWRGSPPRNWSPFLDSGILHRCFGYRNVIRLSFLLPISACCKPVFVTKVKNIIKFIVSNSSATQDFPPFGGATSRKFYSINQAFEKRDRGSVAQEKLY